MGRLIDADGLKANVQGWYAFMREIKQIHMTLGEKDFIAKIDNAETVEAIPIPKGATNGDIMRTIFPKAKHELQKFYEEDTIVFDLDGFYMRISSDWWNSPYKE